MRTKNMFDQLLNTKNTGYKTEHHSEGKPGDKEHKMMSCEERLSHAIHIDKIKIFPNSTTIIEKTKRRYIQESHEDRVEQKHVYNPYTLKYETKDIHMAHDFKEVHDILQ